MDLKEHVKAELEKQGLPVGLVDKINVSDVSEVEKAVADFKATYKPDNFMDFLKLHGFEDQFKDYMQRETDRRVTQAINTYKEKHLKGSGNTPDGQAGQGGDGNNPGESKELRELREMVQKLTQGLNTISEQTKKAELTAVATKAVKEAGLPESWVSRVQVEKAEDVEMVVKDLKAEYDQIRQSVIDAELEKGTIPKPGAGRVTDSDIDDFAKSLGEESEIPVEKIME